MDNCCDLGGTLRAPGGPSAALRPLSRTFQSSQEFTPMQLPPRVTVSSARYEAARARPPRPDQEGQPRHRDRGVSAARGHLHYGFGGDPVPSGVRIEQRYDLTRLQRSNLRSNDQLLPKPQESLIQQHQVRCPFPQEHPYASHVSRLALLPSSDAHDPAEGSHVEAGQPAALPRPVAVLAKAKGGPYRYEVVMAEPVDRTCGRWPGDHGFYQMPTGPGLPKEMFYPTPPKMVAPNLCPRETPLGSGAAAEARTVERSRWRSNYELSFTGHGPMNPILLDDHHLKLLWSLTSGNAPSNKLVERSLPKSTLARPKYGRVPRFVASGWLRDRFVAECAPRAAAGAAGSAAEEEEEESVENSRHLAARLRFASPSAADRAAEGDAGSVIGDGTPCDLSEKAVARDLGGDGRYSSGARCDKVLPYHHLLADAGMCSSSIGQPLAGQGVERAIPLSTTAANAGEPTLPAYQDGPVGFQSLRDTDTDAANTDTHLGLASQFHKYDENVPWSGVGAGWGPPRPRSALAGARPGPGHVRQARPQSALSRLQDSFSRSETLRQLHAAAGDPVDLRDHVRSGRRHHFQGFHSYYLHN